MFAYWSGTSLRHEQKFRTTVSFGTSVNVDQSLTTFLDLNPVWDEILYVPVHSLRESLMLEVMDYENVGKDRSLGSTELLVSELARPKDDLRYPFESTGKKVAEETLRLDKNRTSISKGVLHYTAEFIPCTNLKDVHFELHADPLRRTDGEIDDEDGGNVTDTASMKSIEEHMRPVELTYKAPKKKPTQPSLVTSEKGNGAANGNGNGANGAAGEDVQARDFALTDGEVRLPEDNENGNPSVPSSPTTAGLVSPGTAKNASGGIEMSVDELLEHRMCHLSYCLAKSHTFLQQSLVLLSSTSFLASCPKRVALRS